jgi:hypothetical protein
LCDSTCVTSYRPDGTCLACWPRTADQRIAAVLAS